MDTSRLPLLRQVMKQVTAHPEQHAQMTWGTRRPCGATYCIAGWTLVLSDVPLVWVQDWDAVMRLAEAVQHGVARHPGAVARDLLGLSRWEADALFFEAGDLDAVWDAVEEITEGALKRVDIEAEIALEVTPEDPPAMGRAWDGSGRRPGPSPSVPPSVPSSAPPSAGPSTTRWSASWPPPLIPSGRS